MDERPPEQVGVDATDEEMAALERELLGGERRYTRSEVADLAGVSTDQARALWRALGFADIDEGQVAFTDRDVEALKTVEQLVGLGILEPDAQVTMTRAMGQSLSRLAEWQVAVMTTALGRDASFNATSATDAAQHLVPMMERLIGYVWRRHLAATTGRILARADDATARQSAVGFADLVGFTTLTRHIDEEGLARLVEHFERLVSDVVAELGGRVIKTVGDEVMFTADDAAVGADIALTLLDEVGRADDLPSVRVGVGYGSVLPRLGDVFGEPVNLASRLTSLARPDSVLVDRELAGALDGERRFRLSRIPPRPVQGYAHVQPFRLRRAEDGDVASRS
jgi:adenylate cyclase